MRRRAGLGAWRGADRLERLSNQVTGLDFRLSILRFVLGSFFPQERIFNNFPASFLGSFSATYVAFPFVFNNFLGSFLKKRVFLSHNFDAKRCELLF
jgi:hypothetical protein